MGLSYRFYFTCAFIALVIIVLLQVFNLPSYIDYILLIGYILFGVVGYINKFPSGVGSSVVMSLGTMVSLYLIGFIAKIDVIMFKISPTNVEISFLPIVIGVIIAFMSDGIIKYKSQQGANNSTID
ncbi:hypothetical protein Pryu01_01866 [Paraliobacillus ryukyuensis]|uniref:Uncharacterized protein n=1 Tax=Paraliobacillus ryukyuensis TaxID=200904 RepID=A0A366DVD7_9BACI|nr:hypothetical protein [Paraliobacillus ryukyuensis]RBO93168.1 hypothetical protein DES48_11334 [Paraliobacillus ryukyuensis]